MRDEDRPERQQRDRTPLTLKVDREGAVIEAKVKGRTEGAPSQRERIGAGRGTTGERFLSADERNLATIGPRDNSFGQGEQGGKC